MPGCQRLARRSVHVRPWVVAAASVPFEQQLNGLISIERAVHDSLLAKPLQCLPHGSTGGNVELSHDVVTADRKIDRPQILSGPEQTQSRCHSLDMIDRSSVTLGRNPGQHQGLVDQHRFNVATGCGHDSAQ
jgi:hypothetical protein